MFTFLVAFFSWFLDFAPFGLAFIPLVPGVANAVRTYGDASRVEDVLPLIELLTAREDWFLKNLSKTAARDMVHINLTDTLRAPATLAVEESDDYTYLARTTPSRISNVVEIIAAPVRVSLAQQWIDHYHPDNELARQTTKALFDWGNAAEFDIVKFCDLIQKWITEKFSLICGKPVMATIGKV